MKAILALAMLGGCVESTMGDAVWEWSVALCVRNERCESTHLPAEQCALNVQWRYCSGVDCAAPYSSSDFEACIEEYEAAPCSETPRACVPH
jgi:hypothetical protein